MAPDLGRARLEDAELAAEAAALRRRRELGRRSCAEKGIGPTGGYCLSRTRANVGGNFYLPTRMAGVLGLLFSNASVLDLGCGVGQYGRFFRNKHPSVRWVGVDGAENVEEATDGHVRFADLTEGLPRFARRPWDWAMSIEVAEHVPRAGEPTFVHSLLRWAQQGVVLSWAPPPWKHQKAGHHHVSCQTNEYVVCALGLLGMAQDVALQKRLRAALQVGRGECPWLVPAIMAFRRTRGSLWQRRVLRLPPTPTREYVSAYLNATRARCPAYLSDGCLPWSQRAHSGGQLAQRNEHRQERGRRPQ